jgi:hypothetical protein
MQVRALSPLRSDGRTGSPIPKSEMTKLGSEEQLMNKKRIDLIFCAVNKHKVNMTFDLFLQALIKIAEFKYDERSKDSL